MHKISIPDWCFYKGDLTPEAYYGQLREIGFTGVEMVSPSRHAAARAAGLEILNYSGPGVAQGMNRKENRREMVTALRGAIEQAQGWGIPHVIVFSGNREELSEETGIQSCIETLTKVAPMAEAAGITFIFEMFNAMDHVGYQADNSAYGFAIARAVNSPAVKVLYDIYHMFRMNENVVADIVNNLDIIAHLHVADSPKRTVPVAGGAIDYTAIYQQVQAAGYQGYWGLEFLPAGDVMAELRQGAAVLTGDRDCCMID